MKECPIDVEMMFMPNQQASEVAEPGESALDLPAPTIAAQRAAILRGWAGASTPVWADQFDVLPGQPAAQGIAVVGAIGDESPRAVGQEQALDYRRDEGDFRRGRAGEVASQRNTFAVDHHHPLRAFAALGFADAEAPLFAGAKLASMKASPQSSLCASLSCWRKARQTASQTPSSSHCCRRRQQVLALGYSLGRSRQRAPLRSTQRMPSSTARLSAHGRPRLSSVGKSGSRRRHCWSDRNFASIPSFPHQSPYKVQTFFAAGGGL